MLPSTMNSIINTIIKHSESNHNEVTLCCDFAYNPLPLTRSCKSRSCRRSSAKSSCVLWRKQSPFNPVRYQIIYLPVHAADHQRSFTISRLSPFILACKINVSLFVFVHNIQDIMDRYAEILELLKSLNEDIICMGLVQFGLLHSGSSKETLYNELLCFWTKNPSMSL